MENKEESYFIKTADKCYVKSGGQVTTEKSIACMLEAIYWELKEIIKKK